MKDDLTVIGMPKLFVWKRGGSWVKLSLWLFEWIVRPSNWRQFGWITVYTVKCNLTQLTTKSACVPLEVSGVDTNAHVLQFHMLLDRSIAQCGVHTGGVLWHFVVWQLIAQAVPLPPPFPLSFHCFYKVSGACSSYCVGAHGWVARICQPWKQSSSRSWLPIVEAPGCFRHPNSILAMQLLRLVKNVISAIFCQLNWLAWHLQLR